MYLTPTNKYWAIDCEGDLIPSTVLWCMCAENIVTKEKVSLVGHEEIRTWIQARVKENCIFIAHNMIGYDGPVLNRLVDAGLTINKIIDTFLLSQLYSPSLKGGHSLADWGKRLRYPKIDFNDFSKFSDEMLSYCVKDTELCAKVYKALVKRMKEVGFTETGISIEHKAMQLIKQQQNNGFAFDIERASILYSTLRERENQIKEEIYEYWPPQLERVATFRKPFNTDGNPSKRYTGHCASYPKVVLRKHEGEYDCYDFVSFNIGSPLQRVKKLLELGWKPREYTKTTEKGGGGNPQATIKGKLSPSLKEFVEESGRKEPQLITDWIEINSRANMINTWMEAYNEGTKAIHGSLWLANTLRYRHSNPNTANIPAVRLDVTDNPIRGSKGSFTYEARDLWRARSKSRRLVGVDAKGIQLRVLAHYLNNKDFTEAVLDGDPHSYNQEIGGFRTRAAAKTFIYAFLLGAGDAKVGEIIRGTSKEGREIKQRFVANFPGLENLLSDLERQVERVGRIVLCDGTPLRVEHKHTRLGYLLQGDESRIMKKAMILAMTECRRRELDVLKVGDIHDEWQLDVLEEHVEEFTNEVCPAAFRLAGEFFNYRVPIECDSKVGLTWAETH